MFNDIQWTAKELGFLIDLDTGPIAQSVASPIADPEVERIPARLYTFVE